MPKDWVETSPDILIARTRGNVARVNMELAIAQNPDDIASQTASNSTSSTNVEARQLIEIPGRSNSRFKVNPDDL